MHGACTVSTVHALRKRRAHCGQHRTDPGMSARCLKKKNYFNFNARRRTMCGAPTRGGQRRVAPYRLSSVPCCPVRVRCCTLAARCHYGSCPLCARCLPAVCTVPASSVHGACQQCVRCLPAVYGAGRFLPAACLNMFKRIEMAGCTVLHAWLHWQFNWVILDKGYKYLFLNQYIFSCRLRIWNQFLTVCIGIPIFS